MNSLVLVVVFIILLLQNFLNAEAHFFRFCLNHEDCIFYNETLGSTSPFNDPSISLACDVDRVSGIGTCACRSAVFVGDQPEWALEWTDECKIGGDASRNMESNKCRCVVGPNGLCGVDNGLQLYCSEGFECLDGRCRQAEDLHKIPQGSLCHDTIECQRGLSCQMTKWNYVYSESKCLPANSSSVLNTSDHSVF